MSGRALFDQGYTDLVLIKKNDKRPVKSGWLENRPTVEEVEAWPGNLGVIGEEYPAVDVDLEDEELSQKITARVTKILGPAPLRLSHHPASKLLVYRTDKPYPKKVLTLKDGKGKVEILGSGRQYVVSGGHPKGGEYRWQKSALWDVPSHNLNLMTEDLADSLLASLQEEFGGTISTRKERDPNDTISREDLLAPSVEELRAALARIPNTDAFLMEAFPEQGDAREAWVRMAHAVYGAGGPEFEPEFLDWCDTYADGPSDREHNQAAYRSCSDTYTGWPTIRRLAPSTPEEDFDFDLDEPTPPISTVRWTDLYTLDRILPDLAKTSVSIADRWHNWDGSRWRFDETRRFDLNVRELLRPLSLEIMAEASFAPDKAEQKRIASVARKYSNKDGINAMRELAQASLARPQEDFDTNLMALNTPAGLVNLADGSIRPTTPEDWVTRCTTVAPQAGEAPHWDAFLEHLTGGDDDLASFLQRWCGYCLTGLMGEKKLVFVYGANSNTGKSTFVNAINHAIGDYGRGTDVATFMGGKQNTDALAQLPGVRLASATEASAGQKWDDKIVKAITGGDQIEARKMYGSEFSYRPQFKMLIAGNHRPALKNIDAAMLKRILIVPMNIVVAEEEIDRTLGVKLEEEAPAILQWMIDGCLAWQREGLNPPAAVQAATEEYAEEADALSRWLEDNCTVGDPEDFTGSTDLFNNWTAWNRARGVTSRAEVGTRQSLVTALKVAADTQGLPVEQKKKETGNGFAGIALRLRAHGELEDLV